MDLVKVKELALNIYNAVTQVEVKGLNNIALMYNIIALLQQLMTELEKEKIENKEE